MSTLSNTQIILRTQMEASHGKIDSWFGQSNQDPTLRSDFFSVFMVSEFFILESSNGPKGQAYSYNKNGKVLVPVFTSVNQIRPFIVGTQLNRYRRMKADQLLKALPAHVGVILNPKSKFTKIFGLNQLNQALLGAPFMVDENGQEAVQAPIAQETAQYAAHESTQESTESFGESTFASPVEVAPAAPQANFVRPAPPVMAKKPVAIVRRAARDDGFSKQLILAIEQFSKLQGVVETSFIALAGEGEAQRILIGLKSDLDSSIQVDDLLAEFALSLDSALDNTRPVEICLIEESPEMKDLIESKKARQIYLRA